MLPVGTYVFALRDQEGRVGDAVQAEVSEPTTLTLLAPLVFTMDVQFLDSLSEEPVQAGSLRLERADIPEGTPWQPAHVPSIPGPEGRHSLGEVVSGRWRFIANAETYAEESFVLDLPGQHRDAVAEHGKLGLGPIYLHREKQAVFELVGAEPWTDLTAFRIAYTHDGEQVHFSSDGRATVVLGNHSDPLYMKLWYPDGAEMILYVMGGAPSAERPHQIRIGNERSLDVRLELSTELEELVSSEHAWVRVAFQEKGKEKRSINIPAAGSGVYRCDGVYADEVTISFFTMGEALPVDWQSQWVSMEASGVTTTTLAINESPRKITFVHPDGSPAEGVPFQVYAVPDATGWTTDGITSAEGTASVANVDEHNVALFAHAAQQTQLLIEVPVDLRSVAPDSTITIGGGEPTYFEAICEGQPVRSVWLDLYGQATGVYYTSFVTNDDGETNRISLHPGSQAEFTLYPCNYWTPSGRRPILQGRNVMPLWRKGTLVVTGTLELQEVASAEFGTNLEAWRSTGDIQVVEGKEGSEVCTVPVGEYRWQDAAGEWRSVSVSTEGEAFAR